MPDTDLSRGALSNQEQQLSDALASLAPEALERVLLKTSLRELSAQARVRLAFRLDATLVAHSYRLRTGELRWELPQVPSPLRPVVYSLSHLASQLQSATQALSNGRGDYARLYPLLAPEQLQQMAGTVRTPLYDYAMRLREASGRRETRPRQNKHASSPNLTPTPNADTVLSPDSMALAASDADKTFEAQADETDATSDTFLFIPAGDSE